MKRQSYWPLSPPNKENKIIKYNKATLFQYKEPHKFENPISSKNLNPDQLNLPLWQSKYLNNLKNLDQKTKFSMIVHLSMNFMIKKVK